MTKVANPQKSKRVGINIIYDRMNDNYEVMIIKQADPKSKNRARILASWVCDTFDQSVLHANTWAEKNAHDHRI